MIASKPPITDRAERMLKRLVSVLKAKLTNRDKTPIGQSNHQAQSWKSLSVFLFSYLLLFSLNAHADVDGTAIWSTIQGFFFGTWGLIIGVIMFGVAIFGLLRNGLGWSTIVVGLTALFFLVPGLVTGFQKYAATI